MIIFLDIVIFLYLDTLSPIQFADSTNINDIYMLIINIPNINSMIECLKSNSNINTTSHPSALEPRLTRDHDLLEYDL